MLDFKKLNKSVRQGFESCHILEYFSIFHVCEKKMLWSLFISHTLDGYIIQIFAHKFLDLIIWCDKNFTKLYDLDKFLLDLRFNIYTLKVVPCIRNSGIGLINSHLHY